MTFKEWLGASEKPEPNLAYLDTMLMCSAVHWTKSQRDFALVRMVSLKAPKNGAGLTNLREIISRNPLNLKQKFSMAVNHVKAIFKGNEDEEEEDDE